MARSSSCSGVPWSAVARHRFGLVCPNPKRCRATALQAARPFGGSFMRQLPGRHLLLVASVLFLAGCVSNNEGKIEGTWVSTPLTIKGEPLPPGALRLVFAADGKLEARAGERTFTGTYSLGKGYQ